MSGFNVDAPNLTEESTMPDIVNGDTVDFTINFTDDNDDPIDISGWTVWMTVKDNYTDSDSDAVIQTSTTSHTDATNGKTTLTFSSSDTQDLSGTKVWDLQIKTDAGDIRTIVRGEVQFVNEVTKSS